MKKARNGTTTKEMELVAEYEGLEIETIRRGLANGRIIIPKSNRRVLNNPIGIGKGLLVKINANVGSSKKVFNPEEELAKAQIAEKYGADTIMDLSTGITESDIKDIRNKILNSINIPLGTVPIYQSALRALDKKGAIIHMDEDDLFNVVEEQAKEGVDFFTIHVGVTRDIVEYLVDHPRTMGIVSRGGTFLAAWILHNNEENPFNSNYDYLLEMAQDYDFTLSLGDGMRPGGIFDSTDYAQIQELLEISKMVKRAWKSNIQVMVEGPGHIPANEIERNIHIQKSICNEAPFYVLGPLVTDIAPGYDEIVGAIGGTIAGLAGADYLCYVTPSEHLGLPNIEEVKRGVIASKIAAHAVNIAKYGRKASDWDYRMDLARKELNWKDMIKNSIDPETAEKIRNRDEKSLEDDACSMCGEFCAIKLLKDALESKRKQ
ncbi:MAG: phosphomethylpyrimidine synthase ThiC [Candidatus Lokiarchaeota archaeon]|nr:phosphomethylpyrimidine synthase ThiC [Candidatus Lokiarchaeota archaeon]MBD3201894.1 phosphomethylpyrimidine synthase ThiC [Candidatus Lokiarchaeota archaeon]